jgi:hypothetical protein
LRSNSALWPMAASWASSSTWPLCFSSNEDMSQILQ